MKNKKSNPSQTKNRYRKTHHLKTKSTHIFDLSHYEDIPDRSFFIKVARDAAQNAINENRAMELPITFFQNGCVAQRMPDGSIKQIIEVKTDNKHKSRRFPKGTRLFIKRSPS